MIAGYRDIMETLGILIISRLWSRDMDLDTRIIYRQRATCLPHTWAFLYFTFQLGTTSEVHSSSRDIVQSLVQYFTLRLFLHSVSGVCVFTARSARSFSTRIQRQLVQRFNSVFIRQAVTSDLQKIFFPKINKIRLPCCLDLFDGPIAWILRLLC